MNSTDVLIALNIIQFGQNKLTETWKITDTFFRFSDWTRGYNDVFAGGKKIFRKKALFVKSSLTLANTPCFLIFKTVYS